MSVNVPLLRKAVEWVEAEVNRPEAEREWDQGAWCGTRMCVAGYIAVVEGWKPTEWPSLVERDGEERIVSDVAEEALGLAHRQGDELFLETCDLSPEVEARSIRRVAEKLAGERL